MSDHEAELHYLRWWVSTADFGPGDGDVREAMNEAYERRTGRPVPRGWRTDEDE